ncbi:hypothetical protein [Streptomyces cacaoi]|uniref:hypothetical protein n=1 Tax=Streptomyces cacaoi TaxID=1898 RepID=UPI003747FD2E
MVANRLLVVGNASPGRGVRRAVDVTTAVRRRGPDRPRALAATGATGAAGAARPGRVRTGPLGA